MSCRAGREEPLGRLGANDAYTRHFRLTSGEAFGTHRSQSSFGDLSMFGLFAGLLKGRSYGPLEGRIQPACGRTAATRSCAGPCS